MYAMMRLPRTATELRQNKPRARWCPYGVGYWVVRINLGGTVYQGVGLTLEAAYEDWFTVLIG